MQAIKNGSRRASEPDEGEDAVLHDGSLELQEGAAPAMLAERIGGTTFLLNFYFNEKGTETMSDVTRRLIRQDVQKNRL